MVAKRLKWTIGLWLTRGSRKRGDYARKKCIFAHVGENVALVPRFVPLYSELISFHDNITVARAVDFVTHDTIHSVFNRFLGGGKHRERIGCIEVLDNVFIGSHSIVLYDTRIGPNVIIASGSVVTKDCEPNSVYAGVPARKIGDFNELMAKRYVMEETGKTAITEHNQRLTEEEIRVAWEVFNNQHKKKP